MPVRAVGGGGAGGEQVDYRPLPLPGGRMALPRAHLSRAARVVSLRANWMKITNDPLILDILRQGLSWKLTAPLIPMRSAAAKRWDMALRLPATFRPHLIKELQTLLSEDIIAISSKSGIFNVFFPVAQVKAGKMKLRWCISPRFLNQRILVPTFRMESIAELRSMILPGDYAVSVDLSKAFYHVGLSQLLRRCLKFRAFGMTFEFKAMPFGPAFAPYVFTRLMKPVIRHLRTQGVRISIYADDILILNQDPETLSLHLAKTLDLLNDLGIEVNSEKSHLIPSQKLEHLGVLFRFDQHRFYSPNSKLRAISKEARRLLAETPTFRKIASILGKMSSCVPSTPPLRMRKQNLQVLLNECDNRWDHPCPLSPQATKDLLFLSTHKNLYRMNGAPIASPTTWDFVLTTDASPSGWGASLQLPNGNLLTTKGHWSQQESSMSSNAKELKALVLAFFAWKQYFRRKVSILFRTDNTTALSYLKKMGGPLEHLREILLPLSRCIIRRRLICSYTHIPGHLNRLADRLSRARLDHHNWTLDPDLFSTLETMFGHHTIDLFASRLNTKIPRFASRLPDPLSLACDAMSLHLSYENCYAAPPFPLIPNLLRKLAAEKARATLILPHWPTSTWWPMLLQLQCQMIPLEQLHPTPVNWMDYPNPTPLVLARIEPTSQNGMPY